MVGSRLGTCGVGGETVLLSAATCDTRTQANRRVLVSPPSWIPHSRSTGETRSNSRYPFKGVAPVDQRGSRRSDGHVARASPHEAGSGRLGRERRGPAASFSDVWPRSHDLCKGAVDAFLELAHGWHTAGTRIRTSRTLCTLRFARWLLRSLVPVDDSDRGTVFSTLPSRWKCFTEARPATSSRSAPQHCL